MTNEESVREIVDILTNLKPNEVVTLSAEAGKLLTDTVAKLQESGVI